MGHQKDIDDELLDLWDRCSERQRWVIFSLCWLEMQKQTKVFWLFLSAAVAALLIFAIFQNPAAAVSALVVGMVIAWVILWR